MNQRLINYPERRSSEPKFLNTMSATRLPNSHLLKQSQQLVYLNQPVVSNSLALSKSTIFHSRQNQQLSNSIQFVSQPQQILVSNIVQSPPQVITQKVIQTTPMIQTTPVIQVLNTTVQNQGMESEEEELLIKELEAYKKKCSHLEGHILQFKQRMELIKITESQLSEVLNENKTLTLQNNDLMMTIATLKQQAEQFNFRLSQSQLYEQEFKKVQDLYSQQLIYIEQLKNELLIKTNKIQELQHKEEEALLQIQLLMQTIQEIQQQQAEHEKNLKQERANGDKQLQDKIAALQARLQEKEKEHQSFLLTLSNNENAKGQWEIQLQNLQDAVTILQMDVQTKEELIHAKDGEIKKLRDQINQLQQSIYQYQNLEQEKARLQQMVENKKQEVEQWKSQFAEQGKKLEDLRQQNTKIFSLENKIQSLNLELEHLKQLNDQKNEEVKRNNKKNKDLEKEAEDKRVLINEKSQLEARINQQCHELEQVARAVQQKQAEIEDLKLRLKQAGDLAYQLKQAESVIQQLNSKIAQLENELKQARDKNFKLEEQNSKLNNQVNDLQFKVESQNTQLNQLKGIANDYNSVRQSASDQEFKLMNLSQQVSTLTATIQQKDVEYQKLKVKYQQAVDENDKLKKAINEMTFAIQQLELNIQQLNSQLGQLKDSPQIIANLQAQIEQLKIQIYQSELKYQELVQKINFEKEQYENKLTLLAGEIQRKDYMLKQKQQETESLRLELIKFTEVQIELQQTKDKMNYLLQEIERIHIENQNLSKEVEVWKVKYTEVAHLESYCQDLLVKIVLSHAEVETLRDLVSHGKHENKILRASQLSPFRN